MYNNNNQLILLLAKGISHSIKILYTKIKNGDLEFHIADRSLKINDLVTGIQITMPFSQELLKLKPPK